MQYVGGPEPRYLDTCAGQIEKSLYMPTTLIRSEDTFTRYIWDKLNLR